MNERQYIHWAQQKKGWTELQKWKKKVFDIGEKKRQSFHVERELCI